MKVIFLDIDGVLNGYNKWNTLGFDISKFLHIEKLYKKIVEPFGVHERKVKRLAKIVKRTGAKIVMSSSWRFRYMRYCNHIPARYGDDEIRPFGKDLVKLHSLFMKYGIEVYDITKRDCGGRRDKEILEWLNSHSDIESFIILDDENSFMEYYWWDRRFIQTSSVDFGTLIMGRDIEDSGLKRKHVIEAIKILNGRRI